MMKTETIPTSNGKGTIEICETGSECQVKVVHGEAFLHVAAPTREEALEVAKATFAHELLKRMEGPDHDCEMCKVFREIKTGS